MRNSEEISGEAGPSAILEFDPNEEKIVILMQESKIFVHTRSPKKILILDSLTADMVWPTENKIKIPRSTIDSLQTGTANLTWLLYEELKRQVQ